MTWGRSTARQEAASRRFKEAGVDTHAWSYLRVGCTVLTALWLLHHVSDSDLRGGRCVLAVTLYALLRLGAPVPTPARAVSASQHD